MEEKRKNLGIFLQEKRGEKSLAKIAQEMKVNEEILKKIENGDCLNGDSAYTRLVIKKYYYKLQENYEEIAQIVDEAYPNIANDTIQFSDIHQIIVEKDPKKELKKKKYKKIILICMFMFLLISLILLTILNINKVAKNSKKMENPTLLLSNTVLTPQKVEESKQVYKLEPIDGELSQMNIKTNIQEKFKVKIVATGRVYIDLSQNGQILKQETLSEKQSFEYEITPDENITLNVGNINLCDIYINGIKVVKSEIDDAHQYVSFDNKEKN